MLRKSLAIGIASVLALGVVALATDEPTDGDYTIHNSSGAQTGTCQVNSTQILWENPDEDIFYLDPPTCSYRSPISNTQLVFTDNGDGSYNYTQSSFSVQNPQPAPAPKPIKRKNKGSLQPAGGVVLDWIVTQDEQ